MKYAGYWQTVLPGSKRYLSQSGMVGDNSDVRPPASDEQSRGGMRGGGGGGAGGRGGPGGPEPVKQVALVLDGVFFRDGEFAGPNGEKLYEVTVAEAEMHATIGKIVLDGHHQGHSPDRIFSDIEEVTGPAPEVPVLNPAFRNPDFNAGDAHRWALQMMAHQLAMTRRNPYLTTERMIYLLMEWAGVLPDFRKA